MLPSLSAPDSVHAAVAVQMVSVQLALSFIKQPNADFDEFHPYLQNASFRARDPSATLFRAGDRRTWF